MSETKHTIGPVDVIPAGDGYHSLLTPASEDEPHYTAIIQADDDELSARVATLFAAAPTLLSIAKRWAALDGGRWLQERYAREKAELLADTAAAIAKAEGRS